jgi:transcriptional regulator with PAS, ATPase and Fis domain
MGQSPKRSYPLNTTRRTAVAERCRKALFEGAPCDFADLTEGVYHAWLRSKKAGVNPKLTTLAPMANRTDLHDELLSDIQHKTVLYNEWHDRFVEMIARCGGAAFYLDSQLNIFDCNGNDDLLKELYAKGIRLETCMQERFAGANAVSIAAFDNSDTLLLGPEHYCALFDDYACYAAYFHFIGKQLRQPGFLMLIVVPLHEFSEAFAAICEYHFEGVRTSIRLPHQPQVKLQQCMARANARAHKTMTILVDKNDVIVDIDERLCRLYGTYVDQQRGNNVFTWMPDHVHLFERVKTGETIRDYNYLCKATPVGMQDHEFYMTLVPVYDEEREPREYIGFACTITPAQNVRNRVNRLVGIDAHFTFDDLLGLNEDFVLVKDLAAQAANSRSSVLLCGESGTGKEIFAQAIHSASTRNSKPFIAINCAAIPKELIGHELFGYIDAVGNAGRREGVSGKFEQANQGTLFLDEVAEMPLDMQAVLLRVLEERKVTRLGDDESRNIDVRIIASTNRNLAECIKAGTFRLDLYYRLNVVRLDIPALRERSQDIPLLAEWFLRQFCKSLNKNIHTIAPEVMGYLQSYIWPGNIRELRNVIERCVNICKGHEITARTLSAEIVNGGAAPAPLPTTAAAAGDADFIPTEGSVFGSFEEAEHERIKSLMKRHKGNKTLVAQEMGMARATLYRKLSEISNWS